MYGLNLINIVGLFPRHNVNATNNTTLDYYLYKKALDLWMYDPLITCWNTHKFITPTSIHTYCKISVLFLTMISEFSPSSPQKLMAGQYIRAFLLLVPGTGYLSKTNLELDTHLDYLVPLTKTHMNRKYLVTHSNS